MATEVIALGLRIVPEGVERTNKLIDDFANKADKAGDAADHLEKSSDKARDKVTGLGKSSEQGSRGVEALGTKASRTNGLLLRLASVAGTVGGAIAAAFSVKAVAQAADSWSDMQSRVGAAVKDMSLAPGIMNDLVQMANNTYSSLDQTVGAFAGNIGAFREMGKTTDDAMKYTEALNHALVITATKGEQAASVQMHLAKAMDLGKLAGEGLDSVLANGGRVAEALAKELNTNVGSLRSFAQQGKITSTVIANALVKELENLRKEAGEMPATMADGFTRIGTGMTTVIGVFDRITGASGTVASALISIGDGLYNLSQWAYNNADSVLQGVNMITAGIVGLATAYTATLVPAIVGATAALVMKASAFVLLNGGIWGAVAALVAMRGALIATGIGAVVVIVGTLTYEFLELARKVGGFGKAFSLVGSVFSEVGGRIVTVGKAMWEGLKGVALGIQGAFLNAFKGIAAAWDMVANGITSTWNMIADTSVGSSMGLGVLGESTVGATVGAAAEARLAEAKTAFELSGKLFKDSVAPLQSVAALYKEVEGSTKKTTEETKKLNDTTKNTPVNLNNLGGGAKKAAKDVNDLAKVMENLNKELRFLEATQGMSDLDKAIYQKQQEAGVSQGSKGALAIEEAMRTIDALKKVEEAGKRGAEAVSGIFTSMLDGTKSLKQGVADLLMEMAKVQMQKAILGLGGSGGFLGSAFSWLGGMLTPNANGGIYQSAGLSAYSGSVVSSPTIFPFAKGAGLMGEAGPEAILPLKRGSDGKLGVDAGSGNGGGRGVDVNVTVTVDEEGQLRVRSIAQQESQTTLNAFSRRALNDRVQQIQAKPRRRG